MLIDRGIARRAGLRINFAASAANFVHEDGNGNGKLDQGEKLTCKEPPLNLFDATTVGKAVNVNIAEMVNGTFFRIGSATWTPAN